MNKADFIRQVIPGTYLYVKDLNKIIKVTRVFPPYNPAYACYKNADNKEQAVFYSKVQLLPPETLEKLLNKIKNESIDNN